MAPHWLSEKLRRHPERSPRAALDRTADTESTESTLNEVDHRRTWKKIDFRILPLVSLLYLLSFLDRTNIGNAQVAGIAQDLHLTPLQFSTATAIFFVTYSAFEVPSNILLKLVRPKRWIPAIMLVWGVVQTLTCLVNNYKGLIAGRVFLGVAEAGLAPGVLYYLSFWYPRHKRAFRFSLFFSAASLAGAFGGIFAFSIEKLDGRAGLYGWQWIFLIEGLLTTVVAVGAYFYMTDTPDLARFLSEEEREYVISSLKEPSNEDKSLGKLHFAKEALTDPKAWIQGIMLLTALPAVYAAALFLPTIVNSLGFTAASAQLLSVPPFAVASVYTVAVGYWSDRVNSRGPIAAFNVCLQLIGYALAYTSNGGAGQGYAGVVIAAMGAYANLAINNAWNAGNVAGDAKRGVVIAMTIGLGNCGGVITPFAYDDPPTYRQGHAAVIACLCISMACTVTLMLWFHHLNKRKAERCKREGITQDMVDLYRHEGDASPLFRYVI